jgi:hypothetical protein
VIDTPGISSQLELRPAIDADLGIVDAVIERANPWTTWSP